MKLSHHLLGRQLFCRAFPLSMDLNRRHITFKYQFRNSIPESDTLFDD